MDIRSTLTELGDAFNAHDLDRIMAFFADDCVLEMPRGSNPWGSRFEGKRSVRDALATRFEGLPDVHYGDGDHFVEQPPIPACPDGSSPAPPPARA
ncbi:nuclear transport factor 2 family protein [Mesorhizobium caraganae]|uniref:nuclear transport factor 2 family protein n=1 Tax=Mesorhizobium caraganae TaxID=483206 RepID=UPI003ECCCC49